MKIKMIILKNIYSRFNANNLNYFNTRTNISEYNIFIEKDYIYNR